MVSMGVGNCLSRNEAYGTAAGEEDSGRGSKRVWHSVDGNCLTAWN